MVSCVKCGQELKDEVNFCPHCGASQKTEESPEAPSKAPAPRKNKGNREGKATVDHSPEGYYNLLLILCILTILGSIFAIGRGLLYELVAGDRIQHRGVLYILTSIATIVGAALMLGRKKAGLLVYTMAQTIYLLIALAALAEYNEAELALLGAIFFIVPSLLFLITYWTKWCRNCLS